MLTGKCVSQAVRRGEWQGRRDHRWRDRHDPTNVALPMTISLEEREALRGCLQRALVVADSHGLFLTAVRVAEALDALASESPEGPQGI